MRLAATLAVLAVVGVPAALGQAATTTTLALSSSSVATGTVVTFTATVRNPSLVTHGTVTFCNAAATYCEDSAIIGTAQLTSAGTAIIKRVPGIGVHSYEAVFTATTANAGSNSSASPQALTVTGLYPTATTISASGTEEASNYTLTATVVGTGSAAFSPTSTVWFYDTSDSNAVDGTATLGASTYVQTFAAPLSTATNSNYESSVAVGDFNGDGLLDVAVTNYSSGTVSVFLGAGNGSLGTPTILTAGSSPYWVVAGDFNGDGKLDLAVSNLDSNDVSVFLGNGDGTFQLQATFDVGRNPMGVAVGDFNRDGNLDLAVVNSSGNSVSILLGNGLGGFAAQAIYAVGDKPTFVAVADFNSDGFPDLAVTNYNDSTVGVLLGTGTGVFSAEVTYGTGILPNGIVVGDFNGDGKPDLAVLSYIDTVSVFLNSGTGFAGQALYEVGAEPTAIVAGDFNSDGILDLVVANSAYDTLSVSVVFGSGSGTFGGEESYYSAGGNPSGLAVADFNGDGNPDLVTANTNQTAGVLLDTITRTATAALSEFNITLGGNPQLILAYYGGNTHFSSSTSSTIPTPTSTTLQLSAPSTAVSGLPTMLTAQLSPSTNQSLTPTGTVTFYQGAISLGTGTMQSSGQASLSVATLPAGTDSLTAAYGGDTNFLPVTSPAVSIVVAKGTLAIAWGPPVAIVFGTALSATQLNATTSPALPGTFVYTPAAGTTPTTGTDTLSVTYTPTDTTDYNTFSGTVNLTVNKATPTVTWTTPAAIPFGTVLSATQLDASPSVPGTPVYSPAAGTIPAIGLDTLTVIFTPTDSVDYTTATASVVLTVGDFLALNFSSSPIQTVQQGATASYSLTVAPVGLARLPAEVTFTATGLPPDATITFSPATIPAGSPATEVAVTIHTSSQPAANTGSSTGFRGPAALGMLLLPILGIVGRRKRLGTIPQFRAAVVLGVLSLGAIMGLTGCGAVCTIAPQPTQTSYTVVITAHCGTVQHSANVTVKVEN